MTHPEHRKQHPWVHFPIHQTRTGLSFTTHSHPPFDLTRWSLYRTNGEKGQKSPYRPDPATRAAQSNHGTLWLTSDAFGVEMHKWNAHRNLHYDEETGITTERGTFYKTSDTC